MLYEIHFDFDAQYEPPAVHIWCGAGDVLQVFEEPTCKLGGKMVKQEGSFACWDWEGPWSWDDEDWEPGPFAKRILKFLNESKNG